MQNIFAFGSFSQGNSLCKRLLLALASRALAGVHKLIAYMLTEDGCLSEIVPASTLTYCWNFYSMQKCSPSLSARFQMLLDIKGKNGEEVKNILFSF